MGLLDRPPPPLQPLRGADAMSWYVHRFTGSVRGERVGWTGPIRSERQADREVAAWREAGWTAEKLESCPRVRALVRTWVRERKAARA